MRGAWITTFFLLGCARAPEEPPAPKLPDDTDPPPVEEPEAPLPDDTGFGLPEDPSPDHWLQVRHEGRWLLEGSPYSSLTGSLVLIEAVDRPPEPPDTGDTGGAPRLPDCWAVFDLVGAPPAEGEECADCDVLFEITFTLSRGDPSTCRLPDLPTDGEVRRMGFSSARSAILLDYRDSGIFLPWYPAQLEDDVLNVEWEARLGLLLEEED